jgi:tripartite-type tricarboxylate transporter receptor subunit TctC
MIVFKEMLMTRFILFIGALAAVASLGATAQEYPTRPVRMIVPFAAGGPTDVIARVVAQKLTEGLGQQVVVDNRAGAGGNLGMGLAAAASADGHTLIVVSSSFVVNPGLYSSIPYDPYKSFIPVSNMAASPNVFTVHPGIAARSMKELLTLVSADPKKFSVAKLDFVTVPFGGAGPAVASVVANQTPIGCTALPPTTSHIQAGRLRGIAVTGAKRSNAIADVPTMAEVGFKGQEADTLQGLLVPVGTPKPIVDRLHGLVVKMMALPDVKSRVEGLGFDIIASSPTEFTAQVKVEVEKWTKVVKAAGIKVN